MSLFISWYETPCLNCIVILSDDASNLKGHRPLARLVAYGSCVALGAVQILSTCYRFEIFLIMIYSFILLGGAKLAKREQEAVSAFLVLCSQVAVEKLCYETKNLLGTFLCCKK